LRILSIDVQAARAIRKQQKDAEIPAQGKESSKAVLEELKTISLFADIDSAIDWRGRFSLTVGWPPASCGDLALLLRIEKQAQF
jgi:hypothetical protein